MTAPSSAQTVLAARAIQQRQLIRNHLAVWCEHALQPMGHLPAAHHKILLKNLSDLASGECDRLMISLPPGSAKSSYASVLFPAWWMAHNPNGNVILASHSASLAENFSAQCRNIIAENANVLGMDLTAGSNSVERWRTTNGSSFRCTGVGGAITGFRADLIIIDDPVRSRDDADSPARRDLIWRWYRADLFTRLKPKGKIVCIQTRWHTDDLIGRLMQDQPDEWRNIVMPSLCTDPATDLMGRAMGEALWPAWQPVEDLERIRRTVGEREFLSLYQQTPTMTGGALFDISKLQIQPSHPHYASADIVRAWDVAATGRSNERNPDSTVGVLMARTPEGRFVVLDVVQFRAEPSIVEARILSTARMDGTSVAISIPQDPGASGKAYSQYLMRLLAGFNVECTRELGAKVSRATPLIAQVNGGNVALVSAHWNRSYVDELEVFPGGLRDDQVDASARGFCYLVSRTHRRAEFSRMPYMAR